MSNTNNNNEEKVYQIINEHAPIRSSEIARQLNLDLKIVTETIRLLRRKFRAGTIDFYIYTSPDGYTLDETKRTVVYETTLRLKQIFGLVHNSAFIRNRCKVIAIRDFKKINYVYKPKLLEFESELK